MPASSDANGLAGIGIPLGMMLDKKRQEPVRGSLVGAIKLLLRAIVIRDHQRAPCDVSAERNGTSGEIDQFRGRRLRYGVSAFSGDAADSGGGAVQALTHLDGPIGLHSFQGADQATF
jgi:hypothetical protein